VADQTPSPTTDRAPSGLRLLECCLQLGSALADLEHEPRILITVRDHSLAAGHPHRTMKAHPHMKPFPLEAPHHLSAVRPVGRSRLPRVSLLLNDITRTSPVWSKVSKSCPGSAFRFWLASQRFPSRSELRGLVSCHGRSKVLPSECSPHRSRAPLSGPHAPLRSVTDVLNAASRILSPLVSSTPTPSRGCLDSPDGYGLPFRVPRHASRLPWIRATEPVRSAGSTRFEALILLRVRSHRPELPRTDGRSSPGFLPL